jgi:diguanylate cyclase (GGDEF)-like protein
MRMTDRGTCCDLEKLCAEAGVEDALVFRRISTTTWAHLGGLGRGRGWAGVVEVGGDEPMLTADPGGVRVVAHRAPAHVIGPYYAVGAAAVRLTRDVLVVLGNPRTPLRGYVDHDALRALAACVDRELEEINPSKRLGDELEVLHAVRAVITTPLSTVSETLTHVVGVAVEALSCEIGAVRDGTGHLALSPGWQPARDELEAALDELMARAGGQTLCIQNTATHHLPAPFGVEQGVHSVLAVPFPAPLGGMLVVAHTDAGPRGFTSLCRRLGEQVADTASVIAHTAVLREDLRDLADEHFRIARTDALTGLGNRTRWEEAVAAAQQRVDDGAPIAVLTVDVDGLKELNDSCGHAAGDALLRRCADILREHSRPDDVLCRIGGDEFALLLPVGPALAADRAATLCRRFSAAPSCRDTVAASVGLGTATPGQRVSDAVRDADSAMYEQKKTRRASTVPVDA